MLPRTLTLSTRAPSLSAVGSLAMKGAPAALASGPRSAPAPNRTSALARATQSTHVPARFYATPATKKVVKSTIEKIESNPDMFCFQCEQTEDTTGCTKVGVCGKTPEVAAMQDYTVHMLKVLSSIAHENRVQFGIDDMATNTFTIRAMFATLTNVNFDASRFQEILTQCSRYIQRHMHIYEANCQENGVPVGLRHLLQPLWKPTLDRHDNLTIPELVARGNAVGIVKRMNSFAPDFRNQLALQELIVYGIKGSCAYAEHAEILSATDPKVFAFVHEALGYLTKEEANRDIDALFALAMRVGENNLLTMEVLDRGNTTRFGHPVPTKCLITPVKGKAILVSGHDFADLESILQQTQGTGINVYTHGEMLPAHGYPKLKSQYPHLVANFGGAWYEQRQEFAKFKGAIVMTTNCLSEPRASYINRLFTTGTVGWPNVRHIRNRDFSEVIDCALKTEGFAETVEPAKYVNVGYARNAVISNADKIVEAVKSGAISRFFVIGGCDGHERGRSYFTDLATNTPSDSVILTQGCGKFRFNRTEMAQQEVIPGLPRVLDMGQCNDSYSSIRVAQALAQHMTAGDIGKLPLSFAISWLEQKAVAVLLTLLYLGVRNIRLGPNLPAFLTPQVLQVLVDKFQIKPISSVETDLPNMLENQ